MTEFIEKTKNIYYKERKKLLFAIDTYNFLKKPFWMDELKDNRFKATYRDQRMLMREGRIVIASIVQANSMLFKPGKHNCPAAMVFSEDPFFEENPGKLKDIASELYGIKGKSIGDEAFQKFSDILEDEVVTLFNVKVPEKITFGKKVYFTTFMVHREHLPNGYIDFECFPALICPEKTEASIILPSRYWATESNKKKKSVKILNNKELMELFDNNPEKYIEVIQEHIDFSFEKSRTSWFKKEKWSIRNFYYRFQKTTALMHCGRHKEAKELLEELLAGYDNIKAQESGNEFYSSIISNLIGALIELERFKEAKEKIKLLEKSISNYKDKVKAESFYQSLKWVSMELDILNGDLERGGGYLKSLLESEGNINKLGKIFIYLGIYHFKRGEKDKAVEFFNKASDIVKTPNEIRKIQDYKRILIYKELAYNEDSNKVVLN